MTCSLTQSALLTISPLTYSYQLPYCIQFWCWIGHNVEFHYFRAVTVSEPWRAPTTSCGPGSPPRSAGSSRRSSARTLPPLPWTTRSTCGSGRTTRSAERRTSAWSTSRRPTGNWCNLMIDKTENCDNAMRDFHFLFIWWVCDTGCWPSNSFCRNIGITPEAWHELETNWQKVEAQVGPKKSQSHNIRSEHFDVTEWWFFFRPFIQPTYTNPRHRCPSDMTDCNFSKHTHHTFVAPDIVRCSPINRTLTG